MRTLLILVLLMGGAQAAGTLRYGLEQDPDVLDPARNGSYGDRVVFTAMCDQLLDIDPQLNYVPQLALSWEWSADRLALLVRLRPGVTFQDGAPMDADAVRANLDRYRSAPESLRKTELAPIAAVDVVDPLTIRIRLHQPYAPLLSLLANRPGTPLSPRILGLKPDEIAANPVCAGPFRFVSRVAQDRIVLERFAGYWNAAAIKLDRLEFRIATDATVRRVNLQSGGFDVVGRLAPTDVPAVEADRRLRVLSSPSLGYQLLAFNLKANTPFARDKRVREAFEKTLDREALNQVVFEGRYVPSNQTEAPHSRYWDPAHPVPPRDLPGARALLKQAGLERAALNLIVGNDPVNAQIGQVIQAMAAEGGIDVNLTQMESATMVAASKAGDYQATMNIWSGRPDPDGNLAIWMACKGFLNWGGYCNPQLDQVMARAAQETEPALRAPLYAQAVGLWQQDRPHLVLFHFTWLWGVRVAVQGLVPRPDGLLRWEGVTLTP